MNVGRHRNMMGNEQMHNSYENAKTLKYLGSLLINKNSIHEEIKYRLKVGNSCHYFDQTLLYFRILSNKLKIKYKTIILPVVKCDLLHYGRNVG